MGIVGSQVVRFGSPQPTTCNLSQVHDFIEIQNHHIFKKNTEIRVLYEQGYSIREIGNHFGLSFSTVRDRLVQLKVTLRTNKSVSFLKNQRQTFKNSAPPPFGYCYLEGRLQKDPREYPILQIIEKQRQLGLTPTEIAQFLRSKNFKTRTGKNWRQANVFNIIQRHKLTKE